MCAHPFCVIFQLVHFDYTAIFHLQANQVLQMADTEIVLSFSEKKKPTKTTDVFPFYRNVTLLWSIYFFKYSVITERLH